MKKITIFILLAFVGVISCGISAADTLKVVKDSARWEVNAPLTYNKLLQAQKLLILQKRWADRSSYVVAWVDEPFAMELEYLPMDDKLIYTVLYENGDGVIGKEVFEGKTEERLKRTLTKKINSFSFKNDKVVQEGNVAYIRTPEAVKKKKQEEKKQVKVEQTKQTENKKTEVKNETEH